MKIFKLWNVLLLACLALMSCSIPQVEDGKCTVSRETVRSFYSEHFADGDKISFTKESVTKKEKFLTPEFYQTAQKQFAVLEKFKTDHPEAKQIDEDLFIDGDPFTNSMNYPTGFKVGECEISGENNVSHNVRLFWKNDNKPFERDMKVEMEKRGDKWLISDFRSAFISNENSLKKILSDLAGR
jgi:hypothetical protein